MATSTNKSAAWRKANPEKWKEHQKKYYLKNRKGCKSCGTSLPYPSSGRSYCDPCGLVKRKQTEKASQKKLRSIRADYKLKTGCSICGYNKCASALHFHHLDPTQKESRVYYPEGEEFMKCILVCANCHFEIHENVKIQENGDVYVR